METQFPWERPVLTGLPNIGVIQIGHGYVRCLTQSAIHFPGYAKKAALQILDRVGACAPQTTIFLMETGHRSASVEHANEMGTSELPHWTSIMLAAIALTTDRSMNPG